MTRYGIILSIEKYAHFQSTSFCHADASLLYETLTTQCDYAQQHVLQLRLELDSQEYPAAILNRISQIIENSMQGDTILFYFAGHGHYDLHNDKLYLILPNTYPNNYEKTSLPLEDIHKILRPKDRSCFRIFDACSSGKDVRNGAVLLNSADFIRKITHDSRGWVTLASCAEDQLAYSDPKLGHGIFTYFLCDYIKNAKAGEEILPEHLKVSVVDKVLKHSKDLGFSQIPTYNASITGNVSFAKRCQDIAPMPEETDKSQKEEAFQSQIAKLKEVPNIIMLDYLNQALLHLAEETLKELKNTINLEMDFSNPTFISASDIPEIMKKDIVEFSRRHSLHPRHKLLRLEIDSSDEPQYLSLIPWEFRPKRKKEICYSIEQSESLPKSIAIIELAGDGRCIPSIKILIYVIPLQLSICLLISSFLKDWPPFEDELELLCHSFQMLRPEHAPERARELASFAVKKIIEKLRQCIDNRISELNRELQEK